VGTGAVPPEDELNRAGAAGRVTRDAEPSASAVLLPHLTRTVVFLAPVLISLVCWMVGVGFSILAGLGMVGGRGFDLGPDVDAGLSLIGLAGMALFGLLWLVSLFAAVREVLAEGGVLVEDGAGAREAIQDALRGRLEQHSPPLRIRTGQLEGSPALRVDNGAEKALVVIRPIGRDLRIGWAMWRNRSTVSMLLDSFPGRRGRDDAVLQQDSCATMRGLLDTAVVEGVRRDQP
jgi:hypothetical protein